MADDQAQGEALAHELLHEAAGAGATSGEEEGEEGEEGEGGYSEYSYEAASEESALSWRTRLERASAAAAPADAPADAPAAAPAAAVQAVSKPSVDAQLRAPAPASASAAAPASVLDEDAPPEIVDVDELQGDEYEYGGGYYSSEDGAKQG